MIVDITPEAAREIMIHGGDTELEALDDKSAYYMAKMVRGEWTPIGKKPITIDPNTGKVLNGNHRLRAVYYSGITVATDVVYETEASVRRRMRDSRNS